MLESLHRNEPPQATKPVFSLLSNTFCAAVQRRTSEQPRAPSVLQDPNRRRFTAPVAHGRKSPASSSLFVPSASPFSTRFLLHGLPIVHPKRRRFPAAPFTAGAPWEHECHVTSYRQQRCSIWFLRKPCFPAHAEPHRREQDAQHSSAPPRSRLLPTLCCPSYKRSFVRSKPPGLREGGWFLSPLLARLLARAPLCRRRGLPHC